MSPLTKSYIVCLLIFIARSCSQKSEDQELRDEITSMFAEMEGDFAMAFKDLQHNKTILINEKEMFHAASTMKTPVMIEVYKQAAHNKLSLEDSLLVTNEFASIVDGSKFSMDIGVDSEEALYALIGNSTTYNNLVEAMITMSSNLATNILIEQVGAENITQSMRTLGAADINVLRGVEDIKAFEKGMSNTTSAYDLMVILEKLAGCEIGPIKDCTPMINTLKQQAFNEIIPANLPDGVEVAHKTGAISGVEHDSGIVYLPDGKKYILVLLSKNLREKPPAIKMMAKVSEIIYHRMIKQ